MQLFFFYLWSRTTGLLSELLPQTKNFALLKVRYYRPNVKVWNTSYTKFGFVFIRKRDGYWQPISLAWPGKQSFCLQYYTKFECSYFLDLEKKWSPSPLLSFWKKTRPKGFYTIQKKFLHKENSYNKFSFAIYVFFCYVNIWISVTWGTMFQPTTESNIYHTHSYLDWVLM